jgi:hypothetical protein
VALMLAAEVQPMVAAGLPLGQAMPALVALAALAAAAAPQSARTLQLRRAE